MSFKSELKGNFPTGKQISAAGGRAAIKSAREFKVFIRRKMIESIPTGKPFSKKRGEGFTRSGRHSKRGERPAVVSGNLANRAIKVRKISENSAETFIDEQISPQAERLQSKLGRKIMTDDDKKEAEKNFLLNAESEIKGLL
jgi:hypothetical protein